MKALLPVMAIGAGIALAVPSRGPVAPSTARPAAQAPLVIDRMPSGHFIATARVNDEPVRFVVDTGSDVVALTVDDARRAHVFFDEAAFAPIGHGASGPVRGQAVVLQDITFAGRHLSEQRGVVIEGSRASLLGQAALRSYDLTISGDRMMLR